MFKRGEKGTMFKIGVLVSGGGSNLQSIIDKSQSRELQCKVEVVIGDRECYGVERAKEAGIDGYTLDRKVLKKELCREIDKIVSERGIDLIVLAGFLSIIDEEFVNKWKGENNQYSPLSSSKIWWSRNVWYKGT